MTLNADPLLASLCTRLGIDPVDPAEQDQPEPVALNGDPLLASLCARLGIPTHDTEGTS